VIQPSPVTLSVQPIGKINREDGRTRPCPLVSRSGGLASLHVFQDHAEGLRGLYPGQDVWILTFRTGAAGARGEGSDLGVFATQSLARPNPIDFLRARVLEVQPDLGRLRIQGYDGEEEAPILDIRPALLPLRPLS